MNQTITIDNPVSEAFKQMGREIEQTKGHQSWASTEHFKIAEEIQAMKKGQPYIYSRICNGELPAGYIKKEKLTFESLNQLTRNRPAARTIVHVPAFYKEGKVVYDQQGIMLTSVRKI